MKRLVQSVAILTLCSCAKWSSPQWTAFVFPDAKNIPNADHVQDFTVGIYKSFEECQAVAISLVDANSNRTGVQGDYLCGYKCTPREEYGGMLICKETRK